ncbi:ABC transporter permease [Vibrio genomosp. F10]|uniref:ABC transporter permease n=1 Tax=Vibrio genomosp. F10 TaxID=723171 RepID=UPI0002FDEF81|nr:ABC transporter permease [Vibrio genomosp. F10]OEE88863.1 ABC transporter substrate-binding protein [Vibrio genomosp. F10 str. 9ZD137]
MVNLLLQTWQTLLAHRMKSALAIIAISWGVLSVIVLMALGEGFYRYQTQSFAFFVNDTQFVFPARTSKTWQGLPSRRKINIEIDKVKLIQQAGFVKKYSAIYLKHATVSNTQGLRFGRSVSGVDSSYFPVTQIQLKPGSRNFSVMDMDDHTRVVIVGNRIAQIGGTQIGDQIKINGIPFFVIGLLSDEQGAVSFGESQHVFIPQTTYLDLWKDTPWQLVLKPFEGVEASSFRRDIVNFFAQQKHFDPSDKDALYMPDFSVGGNIVTNTLSGIQIFLTASGVMTMAVGALGVANIMFLSVTERTREVGVRLAIGATQGSIRSQFIIEGLILVGLGAIVGLITSFSVVSLLSRIDLPEWIGSPVITLSSIGMALVVTLMLAFLSSYFPAKRASRLTPVDALTSRA